MKRTLLTILAVALLSTLTVPSVVLGAEEEEETSSLEEGPPVRRLLLLRSGRFEVQPTLTEEAAELTTLQRSFLGQLAGRLREGQDGQRVARPDVVDRIVGGCG